MSAPDKAVAAAPLRAGAKPKRVLACIQCQQRKVKCDRKFPCANCVRAAVQCVPAALVPRQRRRRFPERELLDRLRRYEDLLRGNNIAFDPLHSSNADKPSPDTDSRGHGSSNHPPPGTQDGGGDGQTTERDPGMSKTVNIWRAMNQKPQDSEDSEGSYDDDDANSDSSTESFRDTFVGKGWDRVFLGDEHFLFGSRRTNLALSTLHPTQVHIFRLWQIYLQNVNPILKVTHAPTLQARILDAASDLTTINSVLQALMFSMYCTAILSLADDECRALFGSERESLLRNYQFACQQALLECEVLRTAELDCLAALFLYLISARPSIDPRSLSSMLGVAIRIAQRIGIHSESFNAKCTALEAEMRRRLWWALILFDHRMSDVSSSKVAILTPIWDCLIPLNVNDFDLQPEMKNPPVASGTSTEALFAVVWSELGDFIRHSGFHLDYINPALRLVANEIRRGNPKKDSELASLERMIEEKYLRFCNLENPLHFMTVWSARGALSKQRLLEHYSKFSKPGVHESDAQRDDAIAYGIGMLESDTKLMGSLLTKGHLWHATCYFPLLAYIHIVQDLKKRPLTEIAGKAWEVMSDNYHFRLADSDLKTNPFLKTLSKIILQAWAAREAATVQLDEPEMPPLVVSAMKIKVALMHSDVQDNTEQLSGSTAVNSEASSFPTPADSGSINSAQSVGEQMLMDMGPWSYNEVPFQQPMPVVLDQNSWGVGNWWGRPSGFTW